MLAATCACDRQIRCLGCEGPSIVGPCSVRVVQRVLSNKLSIYPSICLCLRVGRGVHCLKVGGE